VSLVAVAYLGDYIATFVRLDVDPDLGSNNDQRGGGRPQPHKGYSRAGDEDLGHRLLLCDDLNCN
jgi:hypothetical protein